MICIDGDDEWHGRHQDCVQGQRCCCNSSGRFNLEVDLVHCPWYAGSDFRMICNKTSRTLPSHPSEAQAAQQSQVTWQVKKWLRNPAASCSITRSWAFLTVFNCGNFLALKLSHHWFQKHLAWRVFISRRGKLQLWQKSLEVTVTKCQRSCWLSTSEGVSHWPNHKSTPCPKNAPQKVVVMGKLQKRRELSLWVRISARPCGAAGKRQHCTKPLQLSLATTSFYTFFLLLSWARLVGEIVQ